MIIRIIGALIFLALAVGFFTYTEGIWRYISSSIFLGLLFLFLFKSKRQ